MFPALIEFFQKAKIFLDASALSVQSHVSSNLSGSPKVFISFDDEKEGISIDILKASISFEGRIRDGGFGSIFSFTDQGWDDFVQGKSLSQCAFEGLVQTSGSSDSLFLASLYLDELAKVVREQHDSYSIH